MAITSNDPHQSGADEAVRAVEAALDDIDAVEEHSVEGKTNMGGISLDITVETEQGDSERDNEYITDAVKHAYRSWLHQPPLGSDDDD